MATAALTDKFEKLKTDVSQQRASTAHAASSDVVLPEWSVDVAVLPPVEQSAISTYLARGRNAPASEDRNIVSPASGCNAPASGGLTYSKPLRQWSKNARRWRTSTTLCLWAQRARMRRGYNTCPQWVQRARTGGGREYKSDVCWHCGS